MSMASAVFDLKNGESWMKSDESIIKINSTQMSLKELIKE